eukprot:GFUD01053563.1.p1 GENE.GFUD01053563.1~~GFUD01053563.1.p1  ORF type:complete len:469 (+),score=158.15 GFUD01053563.1:85-1491(+)
MAGVDFDEEELRRAMEMSMGNHEGLSVSENPGGSREPGNINQEKAEQMFDLFDILVVEKIKEEEKLFEQFGGNKPNKSKIVGSNTKQNIVELSGLPWSAKDDEIKEFLKDCNIVKILIILNEYKKSSGNAKVWVSSKEDLKKALLCHKKHLGTRYINVKIVEQEETNRSTPSDPDAFTAKLSGLPWTATEQEICEFLFGCEVLGGSAGVNIEMNEGGKPSGSALVQLKTKADVESALKYNKQVLGGRYVDVETTSKDGEAKEDKQSTNSPSQAKENTSSNTSIKEEKFCIKLSNLNRKATTAEISSFLSGSGGHVKNVLEIVLAVDEKGKAGNAFVKIGGEEDLKVCLALNAKAMGNREVEVTRAKLEQFEEAKQGKFFVKLTELSRKVTKEDISKFLSDGNVKQVGEVVITVNEKGKVSGNAFVKIGGEDDQKVALSLDKTAMGNRRIGVCQATLQENEEAKKHQVG